MEGFRMCNKSVDAVARDHATAPRLEAVPDPQPAAEQGDLEDTDETTPEEAGYGYGV